MPQKLSTSAALRYTEEQLGGPCTETYTQYVLGSNTPAIVAKNNPDRVGLAMFNIDVADAYIGLTPTLNAGQGILLSALGGYFACNVRDDFTLPAREWTAVTAVITTVGVIEIIRFKQSEEE